MGGVIEGTKVGELDGLSVAKDGKADGWTVVGTIDRNLVGWKEFVGRSDDSSVGDIVGVSVGKDDISVVGITELVMEGPKVGYNDGSVVGFIDSVMDGVREGCIDGSIVGL